MLLAPTMCLVCMVAIGCLVGLICLVCATISETGSEGLINPEERQERAG